MSVIASFLLLEKSTQNNHKVPWRWHEKPPNCSTWAVPRCSLSALELAHQRHGPEGLALQCGVQKQGQGKENEGARWGRSGGS